MRLNSKVSLALGILIPSFLFSNSVFAEGYYDENWNYFEEWEITDFHSELNIEKDGKITITETIKVDFTNEAHRGVARYIPIRYENDYDARINFISATDLEGESWDITVYKTAYDLVVEMRTLDNELSYSTEDFVVKYKAENAINHFYEEETDYPHSELYWNVNGTDWVVPTQKASATIILPEKVQSSDINVRCITGTFGAESENCEWTIKSDNTIEVTSTKPLAAYENLTVVVGVPLGIIEPPSNLVKAKWWIFDNKSLITIPFTFFLMFFLWWNDGRDERTTKDVIMPHYKPPQDLHPTEVGTLIDEKLHNQDITAAIIHLAIQGHIKILELEKNKDYEFEVIKPVYLGIMQDFEKTIFDAIFDKNEKGEKKKLSELKNKFYLKIPLIRTQIMKQLVEKGYFKHNPETVRSSYTAIGGSIIVLNFLVGGFGNVKLFFSLLLCGIIVIIFAQFMAKKTKKGSETYYELRGLYEYINTAEKDRMKFQEDKNILFEKLLPYAMSFGLIKKWTKAFEDIVKSEPDWFQGSSNAFNFNNFVGSMSKITNNIESTISSAPRSTGSSYSGGGSSWGGSSGFSGGGGGFSGGGFGGGGGRGL